MCVILLYLPLSFFVLFSISSSLWVCLRILSADVCLSLWSFFSLSHLPLFPPEEKCTLVEVGANAGRLRKLEKLSEWGLWLWVNIWQELEREEFVGGGSESVVVCRGGALYSLHARVVSLTVHSLKWEIQIRRNLYFSLILSGPLPFLARLSTFPLRPF